MKYYYTLEIQYLESKINVQLWNEILGTFFFLLLLTENRKEIKCLISFVRK